jgi:XTP/dITP diphosphohydrolase
VFPNGDVLSARGECEGKIGFKEKGDGGFGYDPLFMVDGKSFAELTAEEKDKLSHRGKALLQLVEKLGDYMSL